jgi:hypothetical protein
VFFVVDFPWNHPYIKRKIFQPFYKNFIYLRKDFWYALSNNHYHSNTTNNQADTNRPQQISKKPLIWSCDFSKSFRFICCRMIFVAEMKSIDYSSCSHPHSHPYSCFILVIQSSGLLPTCSLVWLPCARCYPSSSICDVLLFRCVFIWIYPRPLKRRKKCKLHIHAPV